MVIFGIDHIQIAMPKGREQEAIEFYQDILAIPQVPKPAELAGRGGVWFENGKLKIHLGVEDDFRPARKAHPGLLIDDLDELSAILRNKGYAVTEDRSLLDVKRAFTHDPFGNRIELIQYEFGKSSV